MLDPEGDKNNRRTQQAAEDEMPKRKTRAAEHDPKPIGLRISIKVYENRFLKGKEGSTPDLKVLDPEGNKDERYAQHKAKEVMGDKTDKTTEKRPKNVAKGLHMALLKYKY